MDGVIRILTVAGTVGGIDATGEYTEADWRVGPGVAPQTTLASGKLSCAKFQCAYSITTLLDQPVSVQGASFRLGHPVNGPLPGFTSRREWVSAVSRWAGNKVEPGVKDRIVSQAAGFRAQAVNEVGSGGSARCAGRVWTLGNAGRYDESDGPVAQWIERPPPKR